MPLLLGHPCEKNKSGCGFAWLVMLTSVFHVEREGPIALRMKLIAARSITRPPAYPAIVPLRIHGGFLIDLGFYFGSISPSCALHR